LLGVPKLAAFFNDKDYLSGDNVDSKGTTVKLSGCRTRLIWDHGKIISSTEILLFQIFIYIQVTDISQYSVCT
jgi:hypothetical protein